MSSADRTSSTWPRNLPAPEPESDRSLTPPPPGFPTHGVAPSGQGENVERLGSPPYALANFAFFPDIKNKTPGFDAHLQALADYAMHEEWGGKDENDNFHRFYLLRNYLEYSFKFISPKHNHGEVQKDLFKESESGEWIVYDTRLVSAHRYGVKPIYALFKKNKLRNMQPWIFHKWCPDWESVNSPANNFAFDTAPKPYNPRISSTLPESWTEFDPTFDFNKNTEHILRDDEQWGRIKAVAGDLDDGKIGALLTRAIEYARTPTLNPRRMLPQLYYDQKKCRFRQQLLMPLHLMQGKHADLALTLRIEENVRGKWTYYASTVLTIDMAYNNARIFHTVENPWLRRIAIDHDTSSS